MHPIVSITARKPRCSWRKRATEEMRERSASQAGCAGIWASSDAEQTSWLGDSDAENGCDGGRGKGEGQARFEHDARPDGIEAMSLTGGMRSVFAEQHAEATRTHRRVAADCGYAARLRAQSGARQGLMRGKPSAKPPRSSAAAPDSVRGENKLSTRFDGGEGAGRRPEVISITGKHVT